jgi:serine/threonine-protein kinase RsbW
MTGPVLTSSRRTGSRPARRSERRTTIGDGAPVEPEMELTLPARAESLAIVRDALRALGRALALDEQRLADICLAVTEACTNVVLHAYADEQGPLDVVVWTCAAHEVPRINAIGAEDACVEEDSRGPEPPGAPGDARAAEDELTVIVGDWGRGTHEPPRTPGLGLGLRLISALTKSARVMSSDEGHTEVEMTFSLAATTVSPSESLARATAAPR